MKAQTRPQEPEIFAKYSAQWNQQWTRLRESNPSASFDWYSIDGKTAREWALPELETMNQGHCSFCDNFPLDEGDHPIEHFRPKTDPDFYHLAYEWKNLYYCCTTCNGSKREQFDERLLAPDEPDYDEYRYFLFDFESGGITPNPRADPLDQERAQITIDMYKLDSRSKRRIRLTEIEKWDNDRDLANIDSYAFRSFLIPELGEVRT